MSYLDLQNCFEDVAAYTDAGSQALTVLKAAFGQLKTGAEQFAGTAMRVHSTLKGGLPNTMTISTLSTSLGCFTQSFSDMAQQYTNFASMLQGNVIEPMDLFHEHLRTSNSQKISEGLKLIATLQRGKESLRRVQHKYYRCSSESEEAKAHFERLPFRDREMQVQRSAQLRLKATKAQKQYTATFNIVRDLWGEFDRDIPSLLTTLQENEESRIRFLKTTLEKLASQHLRVMESLSTSLRDLTSIIGNVSSNIDIRVLVNSLDGKHVSVDRDQFIPYEDWKAKCAEQLKEDDFIFLEDEFEGADQEDAYVEKLVEGIFTDMERVDSSKLDSLISSSRVRDLLINLLEARKSENCHSVSTLQRLSALYNSLLTSLIKHDDLSTEVFYKVVQLSQGFYSQSLDGRRKYLSSLVSSHFIWSDCSRWEKCIHMLITDKVESDRRLTKQPKSFLSTIKSFANKLPKVLFSGADTRPEKSVAFMVISQFNFYMVNLGLPLETVSDIVLRSCTRVQLDSERTCVLLAELQANQRGSKVNSKDSKTSVRSRNRAMLKWGSFLPISMACEYVDCNDLKTLLLVCKDWRAKLSKTCQWRSLQGSIPGSINKLAARRQFWMSQTQPSLKTLSYWAISRDTEANPEAIQKLGELIAMDIKRSFHNIPNLSPQSVINVLRAYAFYDLEVGYCQGMNYIAGVLYLQIQDEEATFKALVGMVEKYRMSSLYCATLPRLKLMLYQLDRMIGIFLPELHRIFKEEMVASSHFASSWFITLFAATLSSTPEQLDLLYQIWDLFFMEGWKAIFKCSLAILMHLSEVLAAGKLEHVMFVLSKIGTPSCQVQIFNSEFIGRMKSIRISNTLLQDLESEYEHLKLRASMLPL
jgi:hypothetical protein